MHYGFDEQQGLPEMDDCKLFLLKFDTLIYENKLKDILSDITGKSIIQHDANVSSSKWYHETFTAFKATLHISSDLIINIYAAKREMSYLFYPNQHDFL